jgi:hypothetical protein
MGPAPNFSVLAAFDASGPFWIGGWPVLNYDASQSKARKVGEMTSTFTQIAAVVAGLAIVATAFTVMPRRSLLKGTAAGVALGVVAALLIMAVRSFGWHSKAGSVGGLFL